MRREEEPQNDPPEDEKRFEDAGAASGCALLSARFPPLPPPSIEAGAAAERPEAPVVRGEVTRSSAPQPAAPQPAESGKSSIPLAEGTAGGASGGAFPKH
jgi:hypothetical protein